MRSHIGRSRQLINAMAKQIETQVGDQRAHPR